jgi:hypothetical protein
MTSPQSGKLSSARIPTGQKTKQRGKQSKPKGQKATKSQKLHSNPKPFMPAHTAEGGICFII